MYLSFFILFLIQPPPLQAQTSQPLEDGVATQTDADDDVHNTCRREKGILRSKLFRAKRKIKRLQTKIGRPLLKIQV